MTLKRSLGVMFGSTAIILTSDASNRELCSIPRQRIAARITAQFLKGVLVNDR
jgi:hypothetical protein